MKLSVNAFLSLDGVMQGPGGVDEDPRGGFDRGGWLVPHVDEDFGGIVEGDWFSQADAVLLGRSTYEMMQPYWTKVTDPGDLVATVLNTYPKYVVSTSLTEETATWENTTLISDEVLERVRRLKDAPGRELQVHGSLQLARTLHDAGLVDIYRLLIFPVVVGTGRRLFDDRSAPVTFEVVERRSTAAGVTALTMHAKPFATGTVEVPDDTAVGA